MRGYKIALKAERVSIPALAHKLRLVAKLVSMGHRSGAGWEVVDTELECHREGCKCINCMPPGVPVDEGA